MVDFRIRNGRLLGQSFHSDKVVPRAAYICYHLAGEILSATTFVNSMLILVSG